MFKLIISDTVLFDVRGSLKNADGSESSFDFQLEARRDKAAELEAVLTQEGSVPAREYMAERVTSWRKVADAKGGPIEFSAEGLAQMFEIPGMAAICFRAYLAAVGVKGKEKN